MECIHLNPEKLDQNLSLLSLTVPISIIKYIAKGCKTGCYLSPLFF